MHNNYHIVLLIGLVMLLLVMNEQLVQAKSPLDNDIVGEPHVYCGEDGVRFEIETRDPFTGRIYARNEFYHDTCRANFNNLEQNVKLTKGGEFQLNFNECGMRRERMVPILTTFIFTGKLMSN